MPDSNRLKRLIEAVSKDRPEQWRIVYPRIYDEVSGFHSVKELALNIWGHLNDVETQIRRPEEVSSNERIAIMGSIELANLKVPTYFLRRSLLESIAKSIPDGEIDWTTMALPSEAGAFLLPKGGLGLNSEGECSFVWYARFRYGTKYPHPYVRYSATPAFCDHMIFVVGLNGRPADLTLNLDSTTDKCIDISNLLSNKPILDQQAKTSELSTEEQYILRRAILFSFRSLQIMSSSPDLIEHGKFSGKSNKNGSEFWTPTLIGIERVEDFTSGGYKDVFGNEIRSIPTNFDRPQESVDLNFLNTELNVALKTNDFTVVIIDRSEAGMMAVNTLESMFPDFKEKRLHWDDLKFGFLVYMKIKNLDGQFTVMARDESELLTLSLLAVLAKMRTVGGEGGILPCFDDKMLIERLASRVSELQARLGFV